MSGANGRPYGRTRRKLVALLEAEGFSDVTIYAAQGRERSDPREDINRWNGFAYRGTLSCALYSWSTMTECTRRGITITRDGPGYDVEAKDPVCGARSDDGRTRCRLASHNGDTAHVGPNPDDPEASVWWFSLPKR